MRWYRWRLNISYRDLITNEKVRRKIYAATGEYNRGRETETNVLWLRHNVFCFSKGDSTGNIQRKKKKRQTKKTSGKPILQTGQGKNN